MKFKFWKHGAANARLLELQTMLNLPRGNPLWDMGKLNRKISDLEAQLEHQTAKPAPAAPQPKPKPTAAPVKVAPQLIVATIPENVTHGLQNERQVMDTSALVAQITALTAQVKNLALLQAASLPALPKVKARPTRKQMEQIAAIFPTDANRFAGNLSDDQYFLALQEVLFWNGNSKDLPGAESDTALAQRHHRPSRIDKIACGFRRDRISEILKPKKG